MANAFDRIGGFFAEVIPDWVRRMSPARSWRTYSVGNATVGLTSPEDALKIATVWRCVSLVSQSVAMLPWQVFKQDAKGQGVRQPNSPVEWLLHRQASRYMTAFVFKRTITSHAMLWGNGYAEIERDGANRPAALHLLDPSRVTPGRLTNGEIGYKVLQADGTAVILAAADVYHVHGLGFDGIRGYSVLEYSAPTLALPLALNRSLAKFFRDGFRPMGFLKTKGKLGIEAFAALEKRIAQASGVNNAWQALPLDQDMEWQALSVSPEEAEIVDLQKLTSIDICRLFDVPPHMAFDLERATFSNIESQGRDFLTYGLLSRIIQMEQEADWKLLTSNFGGLYSKMNVNAIVRADLEKRFAAYKIAMDSGMMNINEVRALEDLNDIGPDGDVYVRQVQYQPIGTELAPQPVTSPKPNDPNAPPPPKKNGDARAHRRNGSA